MNLKEFDEKYGIFNHDDCYVDSIGYCYGEHDFIDYLNTWIFPDNPSQLVETLEGVYDIADAPEKYKQCKWFNF